jgi:hypothetical protein
MDVSPAFIVTAAVPLTVFALFAGLVMFLRAYAFRPGRAYSENDFAMMMRQLELRKRLLAAQRLLAANANVEKPRLRVGGQES